MIDELLGKWSTPFALATVISGGAAWLTTASNDVEYLGNQVASLQSELDDFSVSNNKIESSQENRLARIETKIDMLIDAIKRQHRHEALR